MKKAISICLAITLSFLTMAQENVQSPNKMLLAASSCGDVQGIKKAISLGADVNCKDDQGNTPVNLGAKLSNYKQVKYFMELGAHINTPNNDNITPLHYSVEYNNVNMVKLLLENGANIDARDLSQEAPIHWAGWTGNIASAKLLLKFGANPLTQNSTGVTPLDLTIRQEHIELEQIFRKAIKKSLKNE